MPRGVVQDLSRPRPGAENTVVLNASIRFAKIISRKFICPKCMTFCGELIPIVDGHVREWMRKNKKNLLCNELQVKVFCYSGCHDSESWGWKLFDWSKKDVASISSWPDQWNRERGALETERLVREQQERRKNG